MNDHQLEDLAAKLWEQARNHASIMDSQTHIQRIKAGLVKVRDSYAKVIEEKDLSIDRLSRETNALKTCLKRLVEFARKNSKTCPICKVRSGVAHLPKCLLRPYGASKWETITGSEEKQEEPPEIPEVTTVA